MNQGSATRATDAPELSDGHSMPGPPRWSALAGWWRDAAVERPVAHAVILAALGVGAFLLAWLLANIALPRSIPLGVVIEGIVQGGLLSFTALGLVLVYRAARFINFSQAAIGGIAASLAELAVIGWGLPFVPSLLLGLAAAATVGLIVDAVVIRRLRNSPRLIVTVATIGLLQVLSVANAYIPHLSSHIGLNSDFNTPLTFTFSIGTILFNGNDVAAIILVPVVLALLWWFLERTSMGTAIRAVADSSERASLLGIPVRRISRTVWMVAALLSGLGAIFTTAINHTPLGLPLTALDLMPALAAFVLARFESFPGAVVWSMLIGIVETAVFWAYQDATYSYVVMFGLVLVGLAVQHRRHTRVDDTELGDFVAATAARPMPAALARLREVRIARLVGAVGAVGLAMLVPLALSASTLDLLTAIPIYGLVGVSLVVLTGWAGQISLGQFAFAGVGAIVTSVFLVHAGVDLFVALLASALVCAAVACAIGMPALRLPGLALAAVTLTFAVSMSGWLMNPVYFPFLNPTQVSRPVLFKRFPLAVSSPMAFYELCLVLLIIALLVAWNFRRSRAGRTILAVRDNARGASAFGISPLRAKLLAFALSGALAGVAGGLYVLSVNGLSGGLSPDESITVFTMVVIGGLGSLSGAVIGATYVECVLHFVPSQLQGLATGAGLLVLIMNLPQGLGGLALQARDLLLSVLARRRGIVLTTGQGEDAAAMAAHVGGGDGHVDGVGGRGEVPREVAPAAAGTLLRVADADVAIGMTPILSDVDLSVSQGEIMALLGTNGAGKSTALRTVAGVLSPRRGRIIFDGRDVTTVPIERRVRDGIVMVPGGRGVFPSLTVKENLHVAGWVARSRKQHRELASTEEHIQSLFPQLADRGNIRAGLLSGGEQQMLAIAQALLCSPRLLMIDELSLGLAPQVVSGLLEVVRGLIQDGVTVVIVEQSVNVAASVAPRAAFMERGRIRFDGPMPELLDRSDLLRSVFLGPATASRSVEQPSAEPPQAVVAAPIPTGTATTAAQHTMANAHIGEDGARGEGALSLVSLHKRFEGVVVLSDVSLQVAPGEIVGIIGSNGAGKTTLFDICSGFLSPDWGRVQLHGEDVTSLSAARRARRGLGRVFQDARLFPSFTVAEAVATSLERRVPVPDPFLALWWTTAVKDSESQVSAWADVLLVEMGLDPYRNHLISEISTGTRRLVELACVVGHEPNVLLLDEPTSGLAQRESEALAPRLLRLREQTGAAFVIIEHDVPLIASIADRLICMHLGAVIAEGTPSEVLEDPLVLESYLGMEEAGTQ